MDWWRPGDFGSRPHGGIENGAAGFLDADMNPKPVYHALDELINGEWKTRVRTCVDGKVVTLPRGETRLDLAKLYPGEVKKGEDGTRVAEVVFSLSAPEDGEYEVKRFNDWFGEYFVNGERIGEINGPSDFPVRMKLRLRKGANEIRCRTRAGSGGKWQFGILLMRFGRL